MKLVMRLALTAPRIAGYYFSTVMRSPEDELVAVVAIAVENFPACSHMFQVLVALIAVSVTVNTL